VLHHVWCVPTPPVTARQQEWRYEFGAHLRALRQQRDLTQEALAERAAVDRKLIYRTELGQTSPRLDAVIQLADALSVTAAELLTLPRRRRRP
jgi:transcriptional regulator with XRE-family HTH domain